MYTTVMSLYLVTVRMGQCGLYLLTRCAVAPLVVSTMMAAALLLYEAITAEMAAVVVVSAAPVTSWTQGND